MLIIDICCPEQLVLSYVRKKKEVRHTLSQEIDMQGLAGEWFVCSSSIGSVL